MDSLELAWIEYSKERNKETEKALVREIEKCANVALLKLGIFKNHDHYEDLIQTAFLEFLECISKYDPEFQSLKSYFYSLYIRKAYTYLINNIRDIQVGDGYCMVSAALKDDPYNIVLEKTLDEKLTAILSKEELVIYNNYIKQGKTDMKDIDIFPEEDVIYYMNSIRNKVKDIITEAK